MNHAIISSLFSRLFISRAQVDVLDTKELTLLVVGVLVLLMGLWAIVAPGWMGVNDPVWHAALKIVVGLVAMYVAIMKPVPKTK
jgi:predicted membrane channel-forming protein YqfA (hemolysin III family)